MAEKDNTSNVVNIDDIRWDKRAEYIDKREPSGCPLLDAFLQDPLPELCKELLAIKESKTRRAYVEAALLTESPYQLISDVLDIPADLIETYSQIFFDVQSMDRISKVELIESCKDEGEKNLKIWALAQGLEFLAWRLGKKVKLSPMDGLNSLMSDCYFKAKEAFFTDNTSESSQQALRWTKQTVDIAKLIRAWASDVDEAIRDIELALRDFTEDEMQFDMLDNLNLDEEPIDFETIPSNEADDTP